MKLIYHDQLERGINPFMSRAITLTHPTYPDVAIYVVSTSAFQPRISDNDLRHLAMDIADGVGLKHEEGLL